MKRAILFIGLSLLVFLSAKSQSALDFDGTNDNATASSVMTNTDNFTLEAWVYPRAISSFSWVVCLNGASIGLGISGSNTLTYLINNGSGTASATIAFNTWTHIALVCRNGTYTLYKNGASQVTTQRGVLPSSNNGNLDISRNSGEIWTGGIDEVRIWSVARTDAEISANYNVSLAGNEAGLSAYYKMNEGTPGGNNTAITQLTDASGHGKTATLNSFALTGTTSNFISDHSGPIVPVPTISSFTPATAATGATVTVTGTNFTDASAVSFGGTAAASFSIVSATSITAVVASGTTGTVSVTTPGGTATSTGTFTFLMVPPGNALALDGVDDYVQINNPYNGFSNEIAVEFWAKINMADCSITGLLGQSVSGSDNMSTNVWIVEIISAANSLYFYFNDNGTWRSVSTSGSFPSPGWHHWVATSNSTSTNLYLDGTLINSSAGISSGIRYSPSSVIHIGKEVRYSSGRFMKGSFDEVRIWNTAKTQSELQSAMYSELVGNESGLVAYYNFNQGVAGGDNSAISTLNDITSNGRNGTLSNFTKTGTTSNFVESYALVVAIPAAATNITGTGFTANWTAPAVGTVTSYLLDVSTSSTFGSFVTGYAGLDCGTSLSQVVSGLTAGTTYYYRIKADKTSVTGTGGYYRTPITVTTSCTNPTSGGAIASAQTICSGLVPAAITSSALPAGHAGTLEYKWQKSTTGSSDGFSDIASSNSVTHAPGALSATTWYKRLSKVTCDATWPAAGESNVVQIMVNQGPTSAAAGSDQTVCASSATLAGNTATEGTGTWTKTSGTATISDPSSPTSGLTGISGTAIVKWTIATASCGSSFDEVSITSSLPANQTVTAISPVCTGNSSTVTLGSSQSGVYYTLRDNSNNAVIAGPTPGTGSSVNFNTGVLITDKTYNVLATSGSKGALAFTGNAGLKKVSLGTTLWTNNFQGTNKLTVEAWVNRTATGSLHTIVSNYEGSYPFLFRIDGDKITLFINSSPWVSGTTTLAINTWYHVAGTYDGTNLKVYVNGVLEGTYAYSGNFISTTNELKIGGGLSNNTEYFPGSISDVRLWNVAKTAAEISASYNLELNGNEPGLIALYKMSEGAGSTLGNSATGNLYPGTLVNSPAWVAGPINASACPLQMTTTPTVTVNQPSFTPGTFTVANLQATGTAIKWYATETGGTALASTDAISNGTTYYASQTVNGVESTIRFPVTATILQTPCAPTGSASQTRTSGQTLADLTVTGSNIRWYSASTGGAVLPSSTLLVNNVTYYASQTVNCTESATRLGVTATIN